MVSRGLDPQKFYWIPNGFSSKEVTNKECLPDHIENQLPENKFIVGYTGSIGIANCLQNLIGAAIKLQDRTDIHFVIVGKGEYKEVLQQQVADHELSNVTFIDPIPKTQIQSMLDKFGTCYIDQKRTLYLDLVFHLINYLTIYMLENQ